jgi:acetyl esterase/lipase
LVRLLAVVWTSGLLVVVVGAYVPRVPVVGFLGSFVTGQYPVHATLAALLGIGVGAAAWAGGARPTGGVAALLALGCAAALVGVLAAQTATARTEGVRIDWVAALTTPRQPDGHPDRTAEFAVDGAGRALRLDLYRPAGPGPHPVVVWVHGGSWVRGERDDRTALDRWLADQGYAVVAVDYRLPPPGPVGEGQRRDVACALGWVAAEAQAEGLDPARITLAGQSAGATLALSTTAALLAGDMPAGCSPGSVPVPRAVVAYYPVTDLRLVDPSLQDAVLGGRADAFPDATRTASPIDLVRPDLPPTLLVMGSADHFVFPERVIAYDATLRAAGVPGRLLVVPYADHVFDFPFGSPGAQLTRPAVVAFLAEHVPAAAG